MLHYTFGRRAATALIALALATPIARPAQANEPVTVAVITAGGVVGAAALTAIGATAAATVTAIAIVASSDSKPAPDAGADGGDGGGEASGQSGDSSSLYVDADGDPDTIEMPDGRRVFGPWILERGGTITIAPGKTDTVPTVDMKLAFDFHGDIAEAPKGVSKYVFEQSFDLEVTATRNPKARRDVILIGIDSLKMTTTDEAGTDGYNFLTIESGDGFAWKAGVQQGEEARYDRLPGDQAMETGKDVLSVGKAVVIPVPVDFKGRDEGTFRIRITFEGSGSRT